MLKKQKLFSPYLSEIRISILLNQTKPFSRIYFHLLNNIDNLNKHSHLCRDSDALTLHIMPYLIL